jgi:hypothetical protein
MEMMAKDHKKLQQYLKEVMDSINKIFQDFKNPILRINFNY